MESAAAVAMCILGIAAAALADPPPPPEADWTRTEIREDCTGYNPLRNPYFGDTHVHTRFSADAVLARTRTDPRDAYSFATGDPIGLAPYDAMGDPQRTATIELPLDFTAVTDHSEGFGEAQICLTPGYSGYDDPICVNLRDTFDNEYHPTNPLPLAFIEFFLALNTEDPLRFAGICGGGPGYPDCVTQAGVVWEDTQDAAEEFYDRSSACDFTTFVAYEWSANPGGNNLHRNVIFRNAEVPALPISYYEEWTVEGLWAQLQSQCLDAPGQCDVLAIPHNSNIAKNKMFSRNATDGFEMTAEQAATRASFEPIMEIMQVKGDSECRNGVPGTVDELCDFEKLSRSQLLSDSFWDQKFETTAYARGALKLGLSIERKTGVNPFELGFIGSTDTHNSVSGATSEVDYGGIGFGGVADSEPSFILAEATPPSKIQANPGGLAVIWAEENSRDAIFAAMRRRETYSTSGTRPIVRAFAGRYPLELCDDPNFVAEGYDKGVPMGGDIGPVRGKLSPRFAIMAQQDPGAPSRVGTPLQRIQVVKGWIDDSTNETFEEVYDVAGDPDNGAGVDDDCNETGSGFPSLCTVWEDPRFKPEQKAFYYVRVLENPTCRWNRYLCNSLGVDCSVPGSVPAEYTECCNERYQTIQERAVASPIWYHPGEVGITKGKIKFKGGQDRLLLGLIIPQTTDELDPAVNDLVLTLRNDGGTVWSATIPAGTMDQKKPGAVYGYKDQEGAIGGVTGLSIKLAKPTYSSNGIGKIKLKTGSVDLSGLGSSSQRLWLDVTSGDYSSTAVRDWEYDAPKMSVIF